MKINIRRYRASKTLPKCLEGNSNTRIFARGDIVDIIFPSADIQPTAEVWIIAHKSHVRNLNGALKLWKRKLDIVLAHCDQSAFDNITEEYPVVSKSKMRKNPRIRDANGYVECFKIDFCFGASDDSDILWVQSDIFPVIINNDAFSLSPAAPCAMGEYGYSPAFEGVKEEAEEQQQQQPGQAQSPCYGGEAYYIDDQCMQQQQQQQQEYYCMGNGMNMGVYQYPLYCYAVVFPFGLC